MTNQERKLRKALRDLLAGIEECTYISNHWRKDKLYCSFVEDTDLNPYLGEPMAAAKALLRSDGGSVMRKVYVIMCNDFPKGVAGSAAKARKICDEKTAADAKRRADRGGGFPQYWRWHEFTLNGEVL